MEQARVFSIVAVLGLAGGVSALLFHEQAAVRVVVDVPAQWSVGDEVLAQGTITIPAGQRLPLRGVTLVLESLMSRPPELADEATCWSTAGCSGDLRHLGDPGDVVVGVARTGATVEPTFGDLWVRSEGYGRSGPTGYGAEVEPERHRVATDIVDDEGNAGRGWGYGGDQEVALSFEVTLSTGSLLPGDHQVTFLAQTGSREMGPISSPHTFVHVS